MKDLCPSNDANYVEMIRCSIDFEDARSLVATSINYDTYNRLLDYTKKQYKNVKFFTKTFKQFVFLNTTYNIMQNTGEIQIYSLDPVSIMKKDNNCIAVGYQKKKLSILNFPSTSKYDDICNITRTTARITNRLFINFEEIQPCLSGCNEKIYHCYANYNHDTNVDWDSVSSDLLKVWNIFNISL